MIERTLSQQLPGATKRSERRAITIGVSTGNLTRDPRFRETYRSGATRRRALGVNRRAADASTASLERDRVAARATTYQPIWSGIVVTDGAERDKSGVRHYTTDSPRYRDASLARVGLTAHRRKRRTTS